VGKLQTIGSNTSWSLG